MKKFNYYKVIPVIITNEGLIHKKTVELLKEVNIKMEWGKNNNKTTVL